MIKFVYRYNLSSLFIITLCDILYIFASYMDSFISNNIEVFDTDQQNVLPAVNITILHGYLICVCREGWVQLAVNSQHHTLQSNQVIITYPSQIVASVAMDQSAKLSLLYIPLEHIDSLQLYPRHNTLRGLMNNATISLSDVELDEVMQLFKIVKNHRGDHDIQVATSLLRTILLIVLSKQNNSKPIKLKTRQEEIMSQFISCLKDDFYTDRSISSIANRMCITPKYLSAVVKSTMGINAQDLINHIVINESKRLLKTTFLNVSEISHKLNFKSPSTFVRFFRVHTGTTPAEYRK